MFLIEPIPSKGNKITMIMKTDVSGLGVGPKSGTSDGTSGKAHVKILVGKPIMLAKEARG